MPPRIHPYLTEWDMSGLRFVMPSTGLIALAYAGAPIAAQERPTIGPGWLCAGDSVAIRWDGRSTTDLFIEAESRGKLTRETPVITALTAWQRVDTTAILRVTAKVGGTTVSVLDTVNFHPAQVEHEWRRPAASCSGRLAVSSMGLRPASISDRIKPVSVTNRGGHAITLYHRGRSIRLEPGEQTDAFNADPFSGDWGVIVDTGPYNKSCPASTGDGAIPPPPLDVLIVTRCAARH
jgi:hypothetical protein